MTPKQFVKAFGQCGSIKAVSRNTDGLSYGKARKLYLLAVQEGLMDRETVGTKATRHGKKPPVGGKLRVARLRTFDLPAKGKVARYLFTCAQNNTKLHERLWENILALASYYDAEIHVSRFAYIKSGLGASGDKEAGFAKKETLYGAEDMWWDERLAPFLSDAREEIAPGLVWCGEMNILPTAERPLSGLEVYTGRRSGIFPHVKLAMESIASSHTEPTKFNYTTGTVTQRNYIQRKAGLKAEFHHCYGALLVEVDSDGDWFVRQLNGNSEGVIYDLDLRVAAGEVTTGHRVEAITWGDIHVAEGDPDVYTMAWGNGGMLDELQPRFQFLHDVLDFRGRSHHEVKNPHMMFLRHVQGNDDVRAECFNVGEFLAKAARSWCRSIVVDSNHHHHLARWLREQDGRADPMNALFWLAMQRRVYDCIQGGTKPNYLLLSLQEAGVASPEKLARFLDEDESFVLCADEHGGIEAGMHGDIGPNGSFGTARRFAKMGRRMNRGHEHSAGIIDGVFTSGTSSVLTPDWTHGPGSWSHSHIVTYKNGKRAIVTMWNNKWRAE